MSESDVPDGDPGWSERVRYSPEDAGFAYRPNELIVGGDAAADLARRRSGGALDDPEPVFDDVEEGGPHAQLYRLRGDIDPIALSRELQDEGAVAQPNHVLFAHCSCGCNCPPHPAAAWGGTYGSPMYGSPMYGSPMYGSPMYGSPMYGSPMYGSPMYGSGPRRSSARPSSAPPAWPKAATAAQGPRVLVLDTGFAEDGLRPAALGGVQAGPGHREGPDEDGNNYLDPAAGHGTFIAGIIERFAPGCDLRVQRVLTTYGDGDEVAIAQRIRAAAGYVDLLNLSFGGHTVDRPRVLAAAVRHVQAAGAVVVASAGNDGHCRPVVPAALPGVIAVGAYGPTGPAPFSNFGPWVRACGPGVDVVSTFFREFHGASPAQGGVDPDEFAGWARWSGTSFAAPAVVAALARDMQQFGSTPAEAVARVVDAPHALRIPGLGSVVAP